MIFGCHHRDVGTTLKVHTDKFGDIFKIILGRHDNLTQIDNNVYKRNNKLTKKNVIDRITSKYKKIKAKIKINKQKQNV